MSFKKWIKDFEGGLLNNLIKIVDDIPNRIKGDK